MIDRTASTCVNPDMVYEGLTDRCDGTTPRSMFNIIVTPYPIYPHATPYPIYPHATPYPICPCHNISPCHTLPNISPCHTLPNIFPCYTLSNIHPCYTTRLGNLRIIKLISGMLINYSFFGVQMSFYWICT